MPDGRPPLSSPTVITAGTTVDLASAVFPVARSAISISAGCGGLNPDLTTDEICRLNRPPPLPEEDAKEVQQLGIVRVPPERLAVQALSLQTPRAMVLAGFCDGRLQNLDYSFSI